MSEKTTILSTSNASAASTAATNPNLTGKTINILGDSLIAGALGVTSNQTWPNYIATRYSMTLNNYGIAGTRIALDNSSGLAMSARFTGMDNSADYIGIAGGTNDVNDIAGGLLTIGTNTDTTRATFKGALNVLCKGLLEKYPTKGVFFVTPLNFIDSQILRDIVSAIIEIAGLWAMPAFDAYHLSGLLSSNSVQAAIAFKDAIHPNVIGHEILAGRVEPIINSLGSYLTPDPVPPVPPSTVLTTSQTAGSFVETASGSGIWTGGGYCVWSQTLAASQAGGIVSDILNLATNNQSVIALSDNSNLEFYNQLKFGVFYDGSNYFFDDAGTLTGTSIAASVNDKMRVYRNGLGVVTADYSRDGGTTWVNLKTFAINFTGKLWLKAVFANTGKFINHPTGINVS